MASWVYVKCATSDSLPIKILRRVLNQKLDTKTGHNLIVQNIGQQQRLFKQIFTSMRNKYFFYSKIKI